jgi:RHS repeat-associated protein
MFLLSHPSLEESEGWGTPDHGRTKMKNMGAPPAINTYTYDAEGNITAVSGNASATYVYNALNQRVRTTVNSGTPTEFVFNANGQRVSEWNGSTRAQLKGKYYWGGTPVAYYTTAASSAGAAAHFEHQDWLGTERMRTSYNSGNNPTYAVEGTFTSGPWGDAQTVASGTDLDANHYATLDYDAETATDHAQFRQYGDTPGNWMSPDPYSGSYDQSNPQSMNRYAYALDGPLSNIDPSGLTPCPPYGCTTNPGPGSGYGTCLQDGSPVDCGIALGEEQAGFTYNIPQNIDGGLFAFDQAIYSGRSMYILVNGPDGPAWESVSMGANSIGPGVEVLSPEAAAEAGLPDLSNLFQDSDQLIAQNNAPNNGTQQKQQTQPQHFWQKPGCGAALAEFGVGVAGTAITVGAVAAAIYLGPEMFEGIEGAATLLHVAPVGAPGLVMMGDGGFKATQTCF